MSDNSIETCLTASGLALLAQSQLGTTVTFTKLAIGDGELDDDTTASTLTDLINPVSDVGISSSSVVNSTVITVTGKITQGETGFYFREIGLYAQDPDTGDDVLYAYINKGSSATYIPDTSSSTAVQEDVTMTVTVGNAANVVISIASSNYADTDLSNLTDAGLDKLNQSKALETGSLSSDTDVYADVYSYAHSTFDSSKFTVVGDVTITDDGIASGFSTTNLLSADFDTIDMTTDTFRIKGRAAWVDNFDESSYPMIFSFINSSIRLHCGSNSRFYLYYASDSSTTSGHSIAINGMSFYDNMEFDFDCYWDGAAATCTITLDGIEYTSSASYTDYDMDEISTIYIGVNANLLNHWGGSVDLKKLEIEKNGVIIFSGNQTGTDTYTIDDETIEIPYALSKTGSKIVDYDYIESVQAVYDEYGYAPYYTIDEDNETFSLPMGEVYGMINKIPANTALDNLTDTGVDLIRCVTDGVYEPVDLTEKFADEIANYSSEWTWIQARIQAADFSGIHIGDYIPVTLTGGSIGSDYEITENQVHNMQVAGIDTYYNSGDSDYIIPHHIDFISMNTIGEYILFNGGASNNGTASEPNPWLASGVYAVLNGVNNYTTSAYNSLKHGYNASSTGGVLQMLPDDLQDVIITKRTWAEEQYSSSALVNYPTGYGWKDYGYLWVPHEVEVCGYQPNSYNRGEESTLDNLTRGLNKMYPLYRYATRVRTSADDNETRQAYWLCVPSGSVATFVCHVSASGGVDHYTATYSSHSVCFGFRIG